MITGIGVHDRPESVFRINWIGCSRSNGISAHDSPERAAFWKSSAITGMSANASGQIVGGQTIPKHCRDRLSSFFAATSWH
jgi:hypothetical protein